MRRLQRLAALDQDAELRTLARADHDGGWRGQTQRAGAGDHENGDEDVEHEVKIPAGQRPDHRGKHGYAQYGGHKIAGDDVCELGNGRFSPLGFFNQMDDFGERRVFTHAGDGEAKQTFAVDAAAGYCGAGLLFNGQRFAGQHAFVYAGSAVEHGAVHGDCRAGANQNDIADGDLVQ
ncbi:hypothetical protein SDC9_128495 [bioreactor metagenome]|uniref:Uncharacterized protein n=1 Tax=bioreactor metagenome TaxID=1076179 RepID=A0A645CXM0_9ZZZZ